MEKQIDTVYQSSGYPTEFVHPSNRIFIVERVFGYRHLADDGPQTQLSLRRTLEELKTLQYIILRNATNDDEKAVLRK